MEPPDVPKNSQPTHPLPEDSTAERVMGEVSSMFEELHRDSRREISMDSDLVGDLGFDSLAMVELQDRLEHCFGIRLSEEVLANAQTPSDWLTAVREETGAPITQSSQASQPDQPDQPDQPGPDRSVTSGSSTTSSGQSRTGTGRLPFHPRLANEPWPTGSRTLIDALKWHVGEHPDLVSIYLETPGTEESGEEITYGELLAESTSIARGLKAEGVRAGDRVALMLPTSKEYFTVFIGTLLVGAVVVPLYPPSRKSVIEEHLKRQAKLLENAGALVLVTIPEARSASQLLRLQVRSLRSVMVPSALSAIASANLEPIGTCSTGETADSGFPSSSAKDIALIQYTSGSTGDPKGVVLTNEQLLSNIKAMVTAVGVDSSDVLVSWLPLYHDMGLIGTWHTALVTGMPLVIMSPLAFLSHPATWLKTMSEYRATLSVAPNFAYQACVDRIGDEDLVGVDLSCWRVAIDGSEQVNSDLLDRFADRFAPFGFHREALCPAYGLAEMGVGVAISRVGKGPTVDVISRNTLQTSGVAEPVETHSKVKPADPTDHGSLPSSDAAAFVGCGVALPGYRIRVVGPDGVELPDRSEGSVECTGPSATSGYFNNESANRRLWDHGWLATGDLGYMANDEIFLTGRTKSLVIRGGRNIHPEELEQSSAEIEGVCAQGLAVLAIPDLRHGTERLVVLAETELRAEDERRELERDISRKCIELLGVAPDEIALTSQGALLRTPSGKLRRDATREAFENGSLGRTSAPVVLQLARLTSTGIVAAISAMAKRTADLMGAIGIWVAVVVIVLPLWLVVQLPISLKSRWGLAHRAGRVLCAVSGIKVNLFGAFPPTNEPSVIVANHQSFVDGLVLLVSSPHPVALVTSTDFEKKPMVGTFLRRVGCVFVERGKADKSKGSVAAMSDIVRAGNTIIIFPEGYITPQPGIRHFRLGAFAVASAVGCPIYPVGIQGTRHVMKPGSLFPHRGDVKVTVGEEIFPSGNDFSSQVTTRDAARSAIAMMSDERLLP